MNKAIAACLLLLTCLLGMPTTAHAYDPVTIENYTPYSVSVVVTYADVPGGLACGRHGTADWFEVRQTVAVPAGGWQAGRIVPGTWTSPFDRAGCLVTKISGTAWGQPLMGERNISITGFNSSGTAWSRFQIRAYGRGDSLFEAYKIFSEVEWESVSDTTPSPSPGFYLRNQTDWPVAYSLDQVGCLHYGVIPPRSEQKVKTGAVWFTLRTWLQFDLKTRTTDWDCIQPVAELVVDVAWATLTGGAGAPAGSTLKVIVKEAIKEGLQAAAQGLAKSLFDQAMTNLYETQQVTMEGQYAGPLGASKCDRMPEYTISGGPQLTKDPSGTIYVAAQATPFTVERTGACADDMMFLSPKKRSATEPWVPPAELVKPVIASRPPSPAELMTSAPTGTPNPVASGGSVTFDVGVIAGRTLTYDWYGYCPGTLTGIPTWVNRTTRTPTWTASANRTGKPENCDVGVTVTDVATGVTSFTWSVQQTVNPEPHTFTLKAAQTDTITVASGGIVALIATAVDSVPSHQVSASWDVDCPGNMEGAGTDSDGAISNATIVKDVDEVWKARAMWTAPRNQTGTEQVCTIRVRFLDAATSQMALGTFLPRVNPGPTLPSVTLSSPGNDSLVKEWVSTFSASVAAPAGLARATLLVGPDPSAVGARQTKTFRGPGQVEDAQITADLPTTSNGLGLSINVDGETPHAHGLIRFPRLIGPGGVTRGARITSATLELNCTNAGAPLTLYRLTQDWAEDDATWTTRFGASPDVATPWASAGADGPGSHAGQAAGGDCTTTGRRPIDVTRFVQEWSDGAPNYGLVLTDSGANGVDFDSSESANSPTLTVQFEGGFWPLLTKEVSGTTADLAFLVQLPQAGGLLWNVEVTDLQGQIVRAPSARRFWADDDDGLPGWWETEFGLDALTGGGDATQGYYGDADGDGIQNFEEHRQGTHPRGFVTRYFAEGATGEFFDTTFALANPSDTAAANVLLRFQKGDGSTVSHHLTLEPMTRATIDAESIPGLETAEFSTVVESDRPVTADRTMTWDGTGFGSHAETGVRAPAPKWYLAEGSTWGPFNLFYLIQNPSLTQTSDIKVTFLRPDGTTVAKAYTVGPKTRFNVWVNTLAEVGNTDVSGIVETTNNVPIIVERAMYLSTSTQTFVAGHESAGITAPSTNWFLAEGATGWFFDEFVLIANPNATAAQVRATYLLPGGTTLAKDYVVPATSRFNIWVDEEIFPGVGKALANTAVSVTLTSQNGMPIIAERAMWWPGPTSATWAEAHNSPGATATGLCWTLAAGEVGAPASADQTDTYILLANTSATAATVRVTLLFEAGVVSVKTFAVPASSRFNVWVKAEFPDAVGKRFGALVQSIGANPAQLVVERAMYSNASGVTWAAGTNALAERCDKPQGDLSGVWLLNRTGSEPYMTQYSQLEVALIQEGTSLRGAIRPVGETRWSPMFPLANAVNQNGQIRFGSESLYAYWNGGDDAYFNMVADATGERMEGTCSRWTCSSASAVRVRRGVDEALAAIR